MSFDALPAGLQWALLPFRLPFMQDAFLIAVLVAVPTALLSCFLVLKGWSLMGDAMSHAVFPGVVLAYMTGLPLAVGAFGAGMVCALATGYIRDNSRVKQDTVMGIVFSGMFALGLVLFVSIRSEVHLDHILFGDMLGVERTDLWQAAAIGAVVSLAVALKWRDLLMHAFDPAQAQAMGLNVALLHYGLLALVALAIVAALAAVGIILSIALLIAPGAIAFLLTRRFSAMLATAVAVAVGAGLAGVYASFFLDSAPGPTIVMLMTLIFLAAFVLSARRARQAERAAAP